MKAALRFCARVGRVRRLAPLLLFVLLVPLVGATCGGPPPAVFAGPNVLFCDIERPRPAGRHCATPDDLQSGIRLAAAAEALVSGQTSPVGLDDSPAALGRCMGQPEAIEYEGPFPQGTGICLDCAAATASDPLAVCASRCAELTQPGVSPVPPEVIADCQRRTAIGTNAIDSSGACLVGLCDGNGTIPVASVPPRTVPEPVDWRDLKGVQAFGSLLMRTDPTPPLPQTFDAGAFSSQTITKGDGFVEFTVGGDDTTATTTARLCGLSTVVAPDPLPAYYRIGYAIDLFTDGRFYIFEAGTKIPSQDVTESWGTYGKDQRFRVHVKDRFDGTATVSYTRLTASCTDGSVCPESTVFTSSTPIAYPIRVDTAFREQNGSFANVRLVRIR